MSGTSRAEHAASVAVLTGDFIASTRHAPDELEAAFGILSDSCLRMEAWHGAPLRLTRFRGDGWQVLLARPDLALRSSLFVHAALLAGGSALATRLACGLGDLARVGTGESLADADGSALHAAGRTLDDLGRGRRLGIGGEDVAPGVVAAFALADGLHRRWSLPQAEVLCDMLAPDAPTQSDLASRLGITQQSVSERLDAAGFWAIRDALNALEWADRA